MPVPGPMRMQGWEGSSGSWKPLALKGTEGKRPRPQTPWVGCTRRTGAGELGMWPGAVVLRGGEDNELKVDFPRPAGCFMSPVQEHHHLALGSL